MTLHDPSCLRMGYSKHKDLICTCRFDIIHPRNLHNLKDNTVIARGLTAEEAKERREFSGDLVVYTNTTKIVRDPWWLWAWEMEDHTSYAWRAIHAD